MITTTAEYALRAVVFLAASDRGTVGREVIASSTKIPIDYLVKVMRALDESGIIRSQRGPGGGYRLIRDAETLSVYDIVSAVSGFSRIEACPLGIAEHVDLCPLHARLDSVAALAEAALRETSISELVPGNSSGPQCDFPSADRPG